MTSSAAARSPSPFELASAIEPAGTGEFRANIPDGWQQGRGAFGGLVLGILARAMIASEPDPQRQLRTLLGDLCGPVVPGPATLRVRTLRRGANLTNLDADLVQNGEVNARASGVLSLARKAQVARRQPPVPERPAWDSVAVLPIGPPHGPTFTQHYEYRATGILPFSGAEQATASGFVREKVAPAQLDAPGVIGLLDAWWPTVFAVERAPRPVATVSFGAQVLCDPAALDPNARLFYNAEMTALHEGFFLEQRQLWSGDVLVGLNQQTFALLK
ncbi:MAG TPA: thioesterase family protein [Polyangiales bacterium]|jgi:hypothetical protein|nr:thioesterase family protein [Polyangiales bacterium]